jgi:hypothetical protein
VFYVAPGGAIMAARVARRGGTWSAGGPTKVLEGPYSTGEPANDRHDGVSPDGQRFPMITQPPADQIGAPQIIIVQNWFEDPKRLVPTN